MVDGWMDGLPVSVNTDLFFFNFNRTVVWHELKLNPHVPPHALVISEGGKGEKERKEKNGYCSAWSRISIWVYLENSFILILDCWLKWEPLTGFWGLFTYCIRFNYLDCYLRFQQIKYNVNTHN